MLEARARSVLCSHDFVQGQRFYNVLADNSPLFFFQGKALCIALARKGVFVTIVDFSEENGTEVASIVQKENKHIHAYARGPSAIFIKCDVTDGGTFS